jgi:glycosyltransferase involved in cell wall biosynthesis
MNCGRIALSHLGGLQSLPLAQSLHDCGLLERFFTGMYLKKGPIATVLSLFAPKIAGYCADIERQLVTLVPGPFFTNKILSRLTSHDQGARIALESLAWHDHAVAKLLNTVRGDVFVGYELSCAESFSKARERGMVCVLEAMSVHYTVQLRELGASKTGEETLRSVATKDREIAAADWIVVLSSAAKASYEAAGFPSEHICVIPPFIDTTQLSARARHARGRRTGIRFLFVGNDGHHKGVDLLVEAFDGLDATGKKLRVIGAARREALSAQEQSIELLPRMSRAALVEHFEWADVLVLPSRFDGFGFVVVEALASGKPVIVSTAVGAADLVREGRNGWIFRSGDVTDLTRAMLASFCARDSLRDMAEPARDSVRQLSFENYSSRVATFYAQIRGRRLVASQAIRGGEP